MGVSVGNGVLSKDGLMVVKESGVNVAVVSILGVGVAEFSTVAGIAMPGEQDVSKMINNEAIQNLLKVTS